VTDRPQPVHGRSPELWNALKASGIVREGDRVRRVIIDIDVSKAVLIYIERFADTRVLEILPVIGHDRSEIVWSDSPDEEAEQA
jgi:hypothetical protein